MEHTLKEIVSRVRRLREHLSCGSTLQALDELKRLVEAASSWEMSNRYEALRTTYGYMLHYLSQGSIDPARGEMLNDIKREIYDLADRCEVSLAEPLSSHLFFTRRKMPSTKPLLEALESYKTEHNKCNLLRSVAPVSRDTKALRAAISRCEYCESDLFNSVWCSYPLTSQEAEVLEQHLLGPQLPSAVKGLIAGALLLSLTKFYDERKLMTLLRVYDQSDLVELQLRALTNAVLAMLVHRERVAMSREVQLQVEKLAEKPAFESDLKAIQLRLAYSRNTENLGRQMNEMLIPNIKNKTSEFFRKVRGGATTDITELFENPEWQQWLDDSGITSKIEHFNELQMQGGDVFISTFSKLKSHSFFNTLSNWFMPFSAFHSALLDASCEPKPVASALEGLEPFCDSDKYSMALSLDSLPTSHRDALLQHINSNMEQLRELRSEQEADRPGSSRDALVNSHLQSLYRFYKLFSRRREFVPVFDSQLDLATLKCLEPFVMDKGTQMLVAEFYFKNGLYEDAVTHYLHVLDCRDCDEVAVGKVWQKLGYSHQSLGHFAEAVKSYEKFLLIDNDDLWTLRHLAACYRRLGHRGKAMELYDKALEMSPDDISLCLNAAHCRFEQGKINEALQLYYRADFMEQAHDKAWRPIAWCNFLRGELEQSKKYYERIESMSTPTATDHLNHAHVLLALGHHAEAAEKYSQSAAAGDGGKGVETLIAAVRTDMKHLLKKGIAEQDVWLVIDAAIRSLDEAPKE